MYRIFNSPAIIFVFILFFTVFSNAYTKGITDDRFDISFAQISREQGLSQASILCMIQDSRGFMWYGTEDGLNRFDGNRMHVYKYDPKNKNGISNSYVKCIAEDENGYLWIGTGGGGLNLYDRDTGKFTSYKSNHLDVNSISNNNILSICTDKRKRLWIGTENGLNKFDFKTGLFKRYFHNSSDAGTLGNNYIASIYEDRSGTVWIGTSNGWLNKYDEYSDGFHSYGYFNDGRSIDGNTIFALYEDSLGNFWIGTYANLVIFDRKRNVFIYDKVIPENGAKISSNIVKCFLEDSYGNFWIGTRNGGLFLNDRKSGTLIRYEKNPLIKNSLSDNNITCLSEDGSGIIWIGTYSGGINKIDYHRSGFLKYRSAHGGFDGLCNENVWALTEDLQDRIWMGTSAGISVFDRKNNSWRFYKSGEKGLSHDFIFSLHCDEKGDIWTGTFDGLFVFDTDKNAFTNEFDCGDEINLRHNRIYSIFEDSNRNIWLGTQEGLVFYNRNNGKFSIYKNDPDNQLSISHNLAWTITEDDDGHIWVGTIDGLNEYDRYKNIFLRHYSDPEIPGSLSHNLIMCVYNDKKGEIWVGTWGGGLNRYDKTKGSFTVYNEKDGLANNVVYGILEDDKGNFWMSTNNGISKFDPVSGKFKNYDSNDGLICNEYNGRSFYKSKTGEMFFGGIEGAVSFFPDRLKNYTDVPNIEITGIRILNQPINGWNKTSMHDKERNKAITLGYKENAITFEYAALHYASPEKNQYAYMLKGFDRDWIYSGNRHSATYTNLNPGKYTFKVKGSNKDGTWNEKGASFELVINPPLWQTWYAYMFYIASLAASAAMFIRFRNKRNSEIIKSKLLEIESKNLLEVSKQKTCYFINLAHEMKTPLTVIRNYLDKYISKTGIDEDLRIIKGNFDKMSRDIVNFLDSEKLKSGQVFYDHNQVLDFSKMLREKISLFKCISEDKNIPIKAEIAENVSIKADPYAVDRLLNNLIDNALRYTNNGGTIMICLKANDIETEFSIQDTGIGIPDEQMDTIFEPFSQLSNEKRNIQGIGMGLYIVKLIVDSLGGRIDIESTQGKGTRFTVTMGGMLKTQNENTLENADYSIPIMNFTHIDVPDGEKVEGRPAVLVVEDNIELLKLICDSLRSGFNVYAAKNGGEALNKLNFISKPGLIISDIMMDVMDGYDLFREVSGDERYNDIPFIFISVKSSTNEKIRALSSGVIDYIYKPFHVEELVLKATSILKNIDFLKENYKKEVIKKISRYITDEKNTDGCNNNDIMFQKYCISKREEDVIREIIKGHECKEIAGSLRISENTVTTHIKNIYRKCSVNNRVGLVNIFNKSKD